MLLFHSAPLGNVLLGVYVSHRIKNRSGAGKEGGGGGHFCTIYHFSLVCVLLFKCIKECKNRSWRLFSFKSLGMNEVSYYFEWRRKRGTPVFKSLGCHRNRLLCEEYSGSRLGSTHDFWRTIFSLNLYYDIWKIVWPKKFVRCRLVISRLQ